MHADLMVEISGNVVCPMHIAIDINGKQMYAAIVNVNGIEGLVNALNVTFSDAL